MPNLARIRDIVDPKSDYLWVYRETSIWPSVLKKEDIEYNGLKELRREYIGGLMVLEKDGTVDMVVEMIKAIRPKEKKAGLEHTLIESLA